MTQNKPMTASERQRKNKQYVRKGKGKATPIELASPISDSSTYTPGYSPSQTQTEHQAEEVVLEAPVYDVGEVSSIASKEDDDKPVDKSVLTTFKDHIAYAIWNGELVDGSCFSSEKGGKDISENTAIDLMASSLSVTKEEVSKECDKAFAVRLDWIKLQVAVDAALSLVEGALFGGQS
ncbi:hypothetical protein LguiA_034367 [Lonicera macranthoides]